MLDFRFCYRRTSQHSTDILTNSFHSHSRIFMYFMAKKSRENFELKGKPPFFFCFPTTWFYFSCVGDFRKIAQIPKHLLTTENYSASLPVGVLPILERLLPKTRDLMAIWSAILTSGLGLEAAARVSSETLAFLVTGFGGGSWSIDVGISARGLM